MLELKAYLGINLQMGIKKSFIYKKKLAYDCIGKGVRNSYDALSLLGTTQGQIKHGIFPLGVPMSSGGYDLRDLRVGVAFNCQVSRN